MRIVHTSRGRPPHTKSTFLGRGDRHLPHHHGDGESVSRCDGREKILAGGVSTKLSVCVRSVFRRIDRGRARLMHLPFSQYKNSFTKMRCQRSVALGLSGLASNVRPTRCLMARRCEIFSRNARIQVLCVATTFDISGGIYARPDINPTTTAPYAWR